MSILSSWKRTCSLVRLSLSGKELDFTKGPIGQAMVVLAIPMVLEMIMESVFAVVDVFWVSKLGPASVAVVGVTESINTLVYAIGIGLSMGTTAMIARRIGEGNPEKARVAAAQAIFLGILASIPICLLGLFGPGWVLEKMGAGSQAMLDGKGYTQVLLGGNVTIILLFVINAIFRGAGDASLAMRSLWFANAINLILDPCLIFGWGPFPEMGVAGAAWATNIGRGAGVLFQLTLLHRKGRLTLTLPDWKPIPSLIGRLLKLSIGGIGQFLIATSSWVFLVRILAQFGEEVLAGYTIGVRIIMFTILPAWGFSNAAATLVGQNLGAKQPDRAEKSVWLIGKVNTAFMCLVGIVFFFFPRHLVHLIDQTPEVVEHAVTCLRWIALGYPFYALGMVLVQAFNGAGDTMRPTWLNFICFWLVEIPLAYMLAIPFGLGPAGVFLSIAVAESLMTVLAWAVFRKGKWKQTLV